MEQSRFFEEYVDRTLYVWGVCHPRKGDPLNALPMPQGDVLYASQKLVGKPLKIMHGKMMGNVGTVKKAWMTEDHELHFLAEITPDQLKSMPQKQAVQALLRSGLLLETSMSAQTRINAEGEGLLADDPDEVSLVPEGKALRGPDSSVIAICEKVDYTPSGLHLICGRYNRPVVGQLSQISSEQSSSPPPPSEPTSNIHPSPSDQEFFHPSTPLAQQLESAMSAALNPNATTTTFTSVASDDRVKQLTDALHKIQQEQLQLQQQQDAKSGNVQATPAVVPETTAAPVATPAPAPVVDTQATKIAELENQLKLLIQQTTAPAQPAPTTVAPPHVYQTPVPAPVVPQQQTQAPVQPLVTTPAPAPVQQPTVVPAPAPVQQPTVVPAAQDPMQIDNHTDKVALLTRELVKKTEELSAQKKQLADFEAKEAERRKQEEEKQSVETQAFRNYIAQVATPAKAVLEKALPAQDYQKISQSLDAAIQDPTQLQQEARDYLKNTIQVAAAASSDLKTYVDQCQVQAQQLQKANEDKQRLEDYIQQQADAALLRAQEISSVGLLSRLETSPTVTQPVAPVPPGITPPPQVGMKREREPDNANVAAANEQARAQQQRLTEGERNYAGGSLPSYYYANTVGPIPLGNMGAKQACPEIYNRLLNKMKEGGSVTVSPIVPEAGRPASIAGGVRLKNDEYAIPEGLTSYQVNFSNK